MTIFSPYPGVAKDLLFELPFQVIKGLWQRYLVCPRQGAIGFEDAVSAFKRKVDSLFGNLPSSGGASMFFPPELRNKIMEAGHSMTLLDMGYKGSARLVEPYCLAYKTRKDGVSREYLYVYDLTGGHRSQIGIKSLVHPNIQSMENTDKTFEPRFEEELCKAGEPLKSSYFQRPPGRAPGSAQSFVQKTKGHRAFSRQGWQYTVQCPYCGRKFWRKNFSTTLNAHKDKYGNRCYGRVGHIV